MGLLRLLGKITGIENAVKWSQCKKILVDGPDIFGSYHIFVDNNLRVAIFLPKSDLTIHVLQGDIFKADTWQKFDSNGTNIYEDTPPPEAFQWKINPTTFLIRGTGLPDTRTVYKGKVVECQEFMDTITTDWVEGEIRNILLIINR